MSKSLKQKVYDILAKFENQYGEDNDGIPPDQAWIRAAERALTELGKLVGYEFG